MEIELKPYHSEDYPNSYCVWVNGEHLYNLLQTCSGCPEQYDLLSVYDMSIKAYFRLRWGTFTVECPDCNGELVYQWQSSSFIDGCFYKEEKRVEQLTNALEKVVEYYEK